MTALPAEENEEESTPLIDGEPQPVITIIQDRFRDYVAGLDRITEDMRTYVPQKKRRK